MTCTTHLRMMKDRTIVKAGEEKNMAVQSPRGILENLWLGQDQRKDIQLKGDLETASNMERRRKPPRIPCATTLHLRRQVPTSSKQAQKAYLI